MTRPTLPTVAVAALVTLSVGMTFLPWVGIGESRRSSYRLLRDLDTLGVLRGPVAFGARLVWVCQPALVALALLLAVLGCRRLSAAVAAAVLVAVAAGSVVVQQSPVQVLIGARLALPAALAGLATLVATGAWPLIRRFRTPAPAEAPPARTPPS